ncbi:uncharacterized protein L203_102230 [Cryptococcus depauperatus CBS 7841]|uniref:Uncharacterized protein n=1 Tax=Cryptococcus depauperatus CBS 7841 TaxID=1295531 RepID=A0A1E3IRP6_9TREE|nr:hypothetical protein L203_01485 [Cryptococcus depauperatus CBS 7841]
MSRHHSHYHSAQATPFSKPQLLRSPSEPLSSTRHRGQSPQQPIYVLTADGSSLFLVDPSKPSGGEEPPPYASFNIQHLENGEETTGQDGERRLSTLESAREVFLPHPSSPEEAPDHGRQRARTLSTIPCTDRPRPRTSTMVSRSVHGVRPARSFSESQTVYLAPDENTPLLFAPDDPVHVPERLRNKRGLWKSVFYGIMGDDEDVGSWKDGWNRFWRPVGSRDYWASAFHLVLLNFPFALLVWPLLVAGTLAGTALLITLPIGAAVWWLTLFISRSAARLEIIMQLHYHFPQSSTVEPHYHPIFYRPPMRSSLSLPSPSVYSHPASSTEQQWDKRFIQCSYAMLIDHYSYSALSYFLLIKPLLTLFSTVVIIVLLPVAVATVFGLPVWLRILERWGNWQAEVAVENL